MLFGEETCATQCKTLQFCSTLGRGGLILFSQAHAFLFSSLCWFLSFSCECTKNWTKLQWSGPKQMDFHCFSPTRHRSKVFLGNAIEGKIVVQQKLTQTHSRDMPGKNWRKEGMGVRSHWSIPGFTTGSMPLKNLSAHRSVHWSGHCLSHRTRTLTHKALRNGLTSGTAVERVKHWR